MFSLLTPGYSYILKKILQSHYFISFLFFPSGLFFFNSKLLHHPFNSPLIHPHAHLGFFLITLFPHLLSRLPLPNSFLHPPPNPPNSPQPFLPVCRNSFASLLAPSVMTMKGMMSAAQPKPRSCHSGHWTRSAGICIVQKNDIYTTVTRTHSKHKRAWPGGWRRHAYACTVLACLSVCEQKSRTKQPATGPSLIRMPFL